MEAVFLVCFLVGLSMTVISLLFGAGHIGGLHLGHVGHDAGGHGGEITHGAHSGQVTNNVGNGLHAHSPGHDVLAFVNFTTIMTFVTWFGGVGYLVSRYSALGAALSVLVAVAAGIGGGAIVTVFIQRVLVQGQTEMRPEDYSMPGTAARVSSTIYPGLAGEVIYSKAGRTQSAAARSLSGEEIARDTEVVILKYQNGTAYVETWQRALAEGDEPAAHLGSGQNATPAE
jgi:hypothetical protein